MANIFRMSTSRRKYFHGKKLNETKRKRNDLGSSVSVSSQFKKGLLFVVHFYSELLSWHQDAKERKRGKRWSDLRRQRGEKEGEGDANKQVTRHSRQQQQRNKIIKQKRKGSSTSSAEPSPEEEEEAEEGSFLVMVLNAISLEWDITAPREWVCLQQCCPQWSHQQQIINGRVFTEEWGVHVLSTADC